MLDWRMSVSYTHLDVYKRQEWDETKPVYLDIISANWQTTTGYCFGGNEVNNNYSYYQQAPEGGGLFSQSQIVFNVKSEIENDIGQAGNSGFITPPVQHLIDSSKLCFWASHLFGVYFNANGECQ